MAREKQTTIQWVSLYTYFQLRKKGSSYCLAILISLVHSLSYLPRNLFHTSLFKLQVPPLPPPPQLWALVPILLRKIEAIRRVTSMCSPHRTYHSAYPASLPVRIGELPMLLARTNSSMFPWFSPALT